MASGATSSPGRGTSGSPGSPGLSKPLPCKAGQATLAGQWPKAWWPPCWPSCPVGECKSSVLTSAALRAARAGLEGSAQPSPAAHCGGLSAGGGCAAVCLTGTAPAGSDGGQGRRRRRRVSCRAARFPCCAAAPSAGRMGAGCWTRTQGWPSRPCRAAVCHQPNQISRSGEQFSSPWESVRALCWPCMWLPASGMGPCRAWGQRALP